MKTIDHLAEIIIGCHSIGVLGQGLPKLIGINIKELAGVTIDQLK